MCSNSPSFASKYPTEVALLTTPLWNPAGANHGNDTWSLNANVLNAICDAGTIIFCPSKFVDKPCG